MKLEDLISTFHDLLKPSNFTRKPILHFKLDMFKRVIVACVFCITLLSIHFLRVEAYFTAIVLCILQLIFVGCYYLAKFKNMQVGTSSFIIFGALVACLFMWKNDGLTDEAVLAVPGFLIFAVLIANFAIACWLLLIISVNMLAIGIVNEYGIYTNRINESDINSAIVYIVILLMITFSVYLASRSIHNLLAKLEAENNKVNQSRQEIIRLQNHDALTGLPNRIMAEEFFNERAIIGAREGFETSLLFIDIDNFKRINDTYGHTAGDKVLISVAERLSTAVRKTDKVCRFGGDEFVIVAVHEHDNDHMIFSSLAETLLNALSEPISLSNTHITLTISIGIAIAPNDSNDFDELYKKADLAMYATKQAGRNSYHYFVDEMHNDSSRQLKIAQALRLALHNNEFELCFQSAQKINDGKITAAEALLRWQHPELGMVEPSEFIPIAEQSGSIADIGYWVLKEAVKACKSWHDAGFNYVSVAVNVSAIQFHRGHFEDKVKQVLKEYDLDGKYLILELTESLLFDMRHKLNEAIKIISDLGVNIAIDDFGTGYSNLGYLHENNINLLKIDRSFVSKLLDSPKDAVIVETIINMSKSLGMRVVAEGVDNKEIKEQLVDMGCTFGQGFLWSRPVNGQDFLDLVRANNGLG